MRKTTHYILYILIVWTALLNIQCSGNGREETPLPQLHHAESVMFDHPDSATHTGDNADAFRTQEYGKSCVVVSTNISGTSKTGNENPFRFPYPDSIQVLQDY